jgi:Tol biopolymer transport system component
MLPLALSAWIGPGAAGAPAVRVAMVDGANLQRPAWSPDGSKLSFEANFHDQKRIELYLGEPRADGFRQITASRRGTSSVTKGFETSQGGMVVHELAFAPRGIDAFVFAASNDRFDYDLYVSEGATVASGPGADGGARWSPDGHHIAFTSARTGEGDLYLIDTRHIEQPPKRLTSLDDSSELYVDWSHDSANLVYVAHSDRGDNLWVMLGVPAAQPSRLTTWPGNQIRPRFSPASNRIAFYANHDDPERFDLYVVEIGAAPRMIVRGVYPDARGPSWTADGRHLVYVAQDDQKFNPIRAVRVDDPTRTATIDLGTVGNGDLDVVARNGGLWVAVVAQGRAQDPKRDFKRLYVAELPPLP